MKSKRQILYRIVYLQNRLEAEGDSLSNDQKLEILGMIKALEWVVLQDEK